MRQLHSEESLGSMELRVHYSLVVGCNVKFHQTLSIQNEIIILIWANSLTFLN